MAADTVSLTYKADIADLRAKLASIPDITAAEARKAVGELDKAMKAAAKAQQQAAQAAKDSAAKMAEMAKATKDASFGSDELGRSAVKLRGILGTIDPRLGEMAGLVDDLVDGFEGLELMSGASASALSGVGVALGAAALAAAGAGTAYVTFTNHSEAVAEAQGHIKSALDASVVGLDATRAAVQSLGRSIAAFNAQGKALEQRIADINNGTSELEILQREAAERVKAGGEDMRKAYAENVAQLDIVIGRVEAEAKAMAKTDAAYADTMATLKALREERRRAVQAQKDHLAEEERQIELAKQDAEYSYESAKALGENTKTKKEATKATEELAAAEEDWINAPVYEVLTERKSIMDEITPPEPNTPEWQEALDVLTRQRDQAHANYMAQNQEEIEAQSAMAAGLAQLIGLEMERANKIVAATDLATAGVGALSNLLDAQAAKGGENASKLAAAAKGFAIAQLTLTGIQAGLAAIAPPPVGYGPTPAGAIAAGVAAASTAAAIAQASAVSPSFNDTPTTMRMEKGGTVRLAPGDYFAAAQKPEDLQRQVGGGGPSTIVVQQVWRGRMIDRVVADTYQRGGKLRRTLGAGQRRKGQANAV